MQANNSNSNIPKPSIPISVKKDIQEMFRNAYVQMCLQKLENKFQLEEFDNIEDLKPREVKLHEFILQILDAFKAEVLIESLNEDPNHSEIDPEVRLIESLRKEFNVTASNLSRFTNLLKNNSKQERIKAMKDLLKTQVELTYDFIMEQGHSELTCSILPLTQCASRLGGKNIESELKIADEKLRESFSHKKNIYEQAMKYILVDTCLISEILKSGISPDITSQLIKKAKLELYTEEQYIIAQDGIAHARVAHLHEVKELLNKECGPLGKVIAQGL